MNILKVDDGMNDKDIIYTEKLADGIYKVTDNDAILKNCQALRITLDKPISANEFIRKVTKLDDAGVLTMGVVSSYVQFIFTNETKPSDFALLLKVSPSENQAALNSAYNATKRLMLDDEEAFSKMFGKL
jgi:hypothetical protein